MKLRFGIVGGGGGFIGNVHRHGALDDDMAILTAGCFSRNAEKNAAAAKEWSVPPERTYDTFEEMAEKEAARKDGIDFVTIATPNNSHYAIAKCFLEHGIHVLSEKPVAMNSAEAEDLERLAAERELLFGVSYTYANYALIRQARLLIENGEIGKIVNIMCEYPQDWVLMTMASGESVHGSWRFDPKIIGDSLCIADIGTHLECLVSMTTGLELEKVLCVADKIPADLSLDTNCQVLMRFEGDIPGMMWASQVATGHECSVSIRIFGEKGAIEWNHDTPMQMRVTKLGQPPQIYTPGRDYLYPEVKDITRLPYGHPEGYYEAFGNIYRRFMQHILAKRSGDDSFQPMYPTIHHGVKGLRFVEACLKSNQENNTWVEL